MGDDTHLRAMTTGHCPRCSQPGPYRRVVCDACWVKEVHSRLKAANVTQYDYLGRLEAGLITTKAAT